MSIVKNIEKFIYVTTKKYDLDDYRKPIVWFDKMLVSVGILSGIIGRIICFLWVVYFANNNELLLLNFLPPPAFKLLLSGILTWWLGEYFLRTGNRGLIYYHMDFLIDYLERKIKNKS
ncbi:MAG: hypothetical protein H7833_20030 [Magnetococcus sp. DMHC-1]